MTSPDPTVMFLIQQSEPGTATIAFTSSQCIPWRVVTPVRRENHLELVFDSCQLTRPGERVLDLQLSGLYDQAAWDWVTRSPCCRNRIIDYPGEDIFEGGYSPVSALRTFD